MKDKTIFITGGNEGIGLATAILFGEQGANVAIMGRRDDKNADALKLIEKTGARCLAITGDVTKNDDINRAIGEVVRAFGALHFAFNNAGVGGSIPLNEMSEEDFDFVMNVNVKGVWMCMKREMREILASGGGAIVNTGSSATTVGVPLLSHYCASKHAVLGLTKSLALEYAKDGLRAVSVAPGSIRSALTDATGGYIPQDADWSLFTRLMPILATTVESSGTGMAEPSVVAGVIAMLVSEDGAFITGTEIRIDGGTHA